VKKEQIKALEEEQKIEVKNAKTDKDKINLEKKYEKEIKKLKKSLADHNKEVVNRVKQIRNENGELEELIRNTDEYKEIVKEVGDDTKDFAENSV
jgi:hypothetical protein